MITLAHPTILLLSSNKTGMFNFALDGTSQSDSPYNTIPFKGDTAATRSPIYAPLKGTSVFVASLCAYLIHHKMVYNVECSYGVPADPRAAS